MIDARAPLSQDRIVDAAVRLVDEEGLAALTMRRLGKELGVEGMSLYTYFASKDALLFELVKRLIDEIAPAYGPRDDWQARLRAVMRSFRQVGLAHPSIFTLLNTRSWDGVALARLNEDLQTLRNAGFDAEGAGVALNALTSFVTGFVTKETRERVSRSFGQEDPAARQAARERRAAYPALNESYKYLGGSLPHNDAVFEAGLDLIMRGLDAALAGWQATARPLRRPIP